MSSPYTFSPLRFLRGEWVLFTSYGTMIAFLTLGKAWLGTNPGLGFGWILFLWLFATMLSSSFAVVRHADHLAEKLKEPLGTLILTLSLIHI